MKENHKVLDMTSGNVLKLITIFIIPLLIGNVFQQVYTLVDTAIVGHFVGDKAISAIGATSALYSLLLSLIISMNNGYSIVITRYFGAKDEKNLRVGIGGTFILNALLTIVVTSLSLIFLDELLVFMQTPLSIIEETKSYIGILIFGLFTTIIYNTLAAILRSLGNSRSPLYFLIISSIVNVILDLVFVGLSILVYLVLL